MLEKQFHLKEHGTTVHTEIIGGITTFLSMAYILAVNPSILGAVMDPGGVFAATALASGVATLVMALYANYPIALSAGLGVNAYFAYTVCLGELGGAEGAFRIALTAVLVEGIIFIIMSFFKIREQIVNSIPENLKFGITCGIGLFITFIGFVNAGIVINDDATLVGLGSLKTAEVALALIGFLIIITLIHYNVTGAVLIGIIITWILGMVAQSIGWYQGASVFPDFSGGFVANLSGLQNTAFKFDFAWAIKNLPQFVAIVFAFLYVDLFDTVGTVVGVADKAGLLDEDGNIPRVGRIFFSDAIGTVTGACLGTSTITSFVESSAGVGAGAKTGLASVVTGLLFLVSILLSPVFLAVPSFATAPALIYVGMLMISSAKKINYDGDLADTVGAFLALAMMPLTYSIATGITVMSWVLLKVFTGKAKDISPVMWIVFVLFALRIAALVTNFM